MIVNAPRQNNNKIETVNSFPNFFYLLSEQDKITYINFLNSQRDTHKKFDGIMKDIESLHNFIVRGDSDDWKRSLVCGICWLPEGLAINNQQLKIALNRSKSSLNALLSKIGLNNFVNRAKAAYLILNVFPFLKDNPSEFRQWTVRRYPNNDQYNWDNFFIYDKIKNANVEAERNKTQEVESTPQIESQHPNQEDKNIIRSNQNNPENENHSYIKEGEKEKNNINTHSSSDESTGCFFLSEVGDVEDISLSWSSCSVTTEDSVL